MFFNGKKVLVSKILLFWKILFLFNNLIGLLDMKRCIDLDWGWGNGVGIGGIGYSIEWKLYVVGGGGGMSVLVWCKWILYLIKLD